MTTRWHVLIAAAGLSLAAPTLAAEAAPVDPDPAGCVTIDSPPARKVEAATRVVEGMLPPEVSGGPRPGAAGSDFAPDLSALTNQNVFGNIWGRCGLSRRDRSLVTLGMLIALRAESELRFHFPAAIRNGLTRRELEEVIYQASAYAGFPAAALARRAAQATIAGEPARAGATPPRPERTPPAAPDRAPR